MRYVEARCSQDEEEHAYRIYISDAFKSLFGLNIRYYDFINGQQEKQEEKPKDIINRIAGKISIVAEQ